MKRCPLCDTDYPNHHITCDRDGATLIASRDLDPGTIIRNKYRIIRAIGRGGMGTVYLADHILLGRPRALKFISSELSQDSKLLKRFRMEALAAIELRHPNVAEVVDLDQAEDGSPFIAMEYVDGYDLREALAHGPMQVERALDITRGVALGLAAAHAKGIVHRDIKPENILLAIGPGGTETPKVVDFGIAAIKGNVNVTGTARTRMMLTPAYAAPEQWMGIASDEIDGRADLYALGGVLTEMLTGQSGFHSDEPEARLYKEQHAEKTPPSNMRPELRTWPGLDELVLRLLARDRERRPRDVSEFLHDLDIVRSRRTPPAAETPQRINTPPPAKPPQNTPPPHVSPPLQQPPLVSPVKKRKFNVLTWLAVGAACVAIGSLVWIGVSSVTKQDQPEKKAPTAGELRTNSKDHLTYAWIAAGGFEMGCSPGDSECRDDEKPPHAVSISKGFWIGQTHVPVSAWKRYRAETNVAPLATADTLGRNNFNESGPDDMPVVLLTAKQASDYCTWAGMTLPTEAQWEYAARAGFTSRRYGDLDAISWYGNNSGNQPIDTTAIWNSSGSDLNKYEQALKDNGNSVHPVAQKQANGWQLYDMLGDVVDWTADWYSATYYQSSGEQDPTGPATPAKQKVTRGGSWASMAEDVRVSERTAIDADKRYTGVGFRCAGDLPQ